MSVPLRAWFMSSSQSAESAFTCCCCLTAFCNVACAMQRCAEMQDEEVRIVKGVDGRLTGEAYVHISGTRAKLRLALAKDRTLMPVSLPKSLSLLCSAQNARLVCLATALKLGSQASCSHQTDTHFVHIRLTAQLHLGCLLHIGCMTCGLKSSWNSCFAVTIVLQYIIVPAPMVSKINRSTRVVMLIAG